MLQEEGINIYSDAEQVVHAMFTASIIALQLLAIMKDLLMLRSYFIKGTSPGRWTQFSETKSTWDSC